MVDHTIAALRSTNWEVLPEFTFNQFGDRGSVDILAWHAPSRTLLIIEVKATLTDLQDLLSSLSRKLRVVPGLVRAQFGWNPVSVGRMIVVAGTTANRSVVARHAATFDASFPARSRDARAWLRRPRGTLAAVWFVSTSALGTTKSVARDRVRVGARPRA